eukprot:TRINITY_DN13730_c0_g1_i1.p1 TRINITY_DN13730_c0_g1~~TRINITY_DN13730_c0_g1_i1.p1  ORF type:complete len:1096 (-),score=278.81 TRINITY_DN13730_c0_g1_i1:141-3428(-)
MFERSLEDLVRGLRNNKKNESAFIAQVMTEIKEEIRSKEMAKKVVAVQKLVYLQMHSYDITWAAFHMIEVMSSPKFTEKRVGYWAAAQCFKEDTDVIMLATNLIRKDITSSNVWDSGIALNCLSTICNTDLARDLAADVVALLNHSKPYIRKKACLVLYKIFLKFPDALRPSFPRLKDKLEDSDPAVISGAVNVICELARKNPKNYLSLAPQLYGLLTNSTNNWMLIKIVKLFGALLPLEPRLAKKLVTPLSNIINSTSAKSLLYECIQTCTIGLSDHLPTIKLCIVKLRSFVEDPDQNLKYLGLLALNNIMKVHPKAVSEHRDLVLACLEDADITIRLRALDLLEGMVNKRNLPEVIGKLLEQIEKAEVRAYKDAMVEKIISICSKNSYQHITDFEWYISVLIQLSHTPGIQFGSSISNQILDVAVRVKVVRPYAVQSMQSLLHDSTILSDEIQVGGNCEVLYAAAYIVGEFAYHIDDYVTAMESIFLPAITSLPSHIQAVYCQSALKIFAHCLALAYNVQLNEEEPLEDKASNVLDTINQIIEIVKAKISLFTQSPHLEVQERACFMQAIVNFYSEAEEEKKKSIGTDIASMFREPLNPVASKIQKKIPLPEGLDLESWINEPPPEEEEEDYSSKGFEFLSKSESEEQAEKVQYNPEEEKKRAERERRRKANDPFYLGGKSSNPNSPSVEAIEDIPMKHLTTEEMGIKPKFGSRPTSFSSGLKKPKKKTAPVQIMKDETPEGNWEDSDEEEEKEKDALADIDFSSPLRPDEQLPVQAHRVVKDAAIPTKKVKKERKSKEERPSKSGEKEKKSKTKEGKGSEEKTKKSSREKKEKTRKTSEGKEKSKKKVAKSEEPQGVTKPALPLQAVVDESKMMDLFKDENVSIIFEPRVNSKEPKKILIFLRVKNIGSEEISELEIKPSGEVTPINEPTIKFSGVSTSSPADKKILFNCGSFYNPPQCTGTVVYKVGEVEKQIEYSAVIPCSTFIIATKVSKEEYLSLMTEGSNDLKGASNVFRPKNVKPFVMGIAMLLHLELVSFEGAVSLYGKTTQGDHVFVLAKPNPENGTVSVDIKTHHQTFTDHVSSEVQNAFPQN